MISITRVLMFKYLLIITMSTATTVNLYAGNEQAEPILLQDGYLAYLDPDSLEHVEKKEEQIKESIEEPLNKNTTENIQHAKQEDYHVDQGEKYEDPFENYNRAMYTINKKIDQYLIKPVAEFYFHMVPPPIKYMVTNFFDNIQDISVVINDFLQGEYYQVPKSFNRLFLNSTFGIFGLIDVASNIDLPKRANDFGVTLGRWSMTDSSYIVLPIIGPSTIRDTLGMGFGLFSNPMFYISEDYIIYGSLLSALEKRASLLPLEKIIDTAADEEYTFVRNTYLDYRYTLINGEVPNVKKETHETELLEDILSNEGNKASGMELNDLESLEPLEPLQSIEPLKPLESVDTNANTKSLNK
jgi:ABC-type transporter lipoprotein component MlaA